MNKFYIFPDGTITMDKTYYLECMKSYDGGFEFS